MSLIFGTNRLASSLCFVIETDFRCVFSSLQSFLYPVAIAVTNSYDYYDDQHCYSTADRAFTFGLLERLRAPFDGVPSVARHVADSRERFAVAFGVYRNYRVRVRAARNIDCLCECVRFARVICHDDELVSSGVLREYVIRERYVSARLHGCRYCVQRIRPIAEHAHRP